jgi:hypothetical protein
MISQLINELNVVAGALRGEHKRFPYGRYEQGQFQVHGLPPGLQMKRPSNYGRKDLETLLASMDAIVITGRSVGMWQIVSQQLMNKNKYRYTLL